MSMQSNHFPETLDRPEQSPELFEAYAEFSLRAAVSDLKAAGVSDTEIANLVSDVLFKKPDEAPNSSMADPIPF